MNAPPTGSPVPLGEGQGEGSGARPFHFGVVILGAGASSRMGRPKLLLPWADSTVLGHLIATWRSLGAAQIGVVHWPEDAALQAEAARHQVDAMIPNPERDKGMFSSIVHAARWAGWRPELTHLILSLGDQPHVRRDTLARLIEAARHKREFIWQPSFADKPKHPVIFPIDIFLGMRQTQFVTLRDFLADQKEIKRQVECDDTGLNLDLDYPEDYRKAVLLPGCGATRRR